MLRLLGIKGSSKTHSVVDELLDLQVIAHDTNSSKGYVECVCRERILRVQ